MPTAQTLGLDIIVLISFMGRKQRISKYMATVQEEMDSLIVTGILVGIMEYQVYYDVIIIIITIIII
jgi:hypothetical protein